MIELKIPSVGESVTTVTLSQWLKADGEWVEMDEAVAELESDKATVELNAEASGTLNILIEEGEDVEVGAVVAKIDDSAEPPADKPQPKEETKSTTANSEPTSKQETAEQEKSTYASGTPSPAAAKILAEKGIDASNVKGSGKDGRITKEDAMKAQPEKASPQKSATEPASYGMQGESSRESRREKMSNLRRTVARRLVAAKNETAMLTTFNEVNMKPVMDVRSKYKEKFKEKHGVGLGFMSFFTRAVVLSLQKFPAVNAFIDGEEVIFNDFQDISIAVSGPKGLMVPVIRNAEAMTLWEIEAEIMRLAAKVRDGKISIDEMSGGTFTISNGGVFGSMLSTPILNPPQSAILGMHNILQRPIVENGEIVARPMMYLALSYDHRIIDGRESVGFLVSIKNYLENPVSLLSGNDPVQQLMGM
jgi:2-oxoglutarate dehydrogenase E2 component (dihydrolipoamide succinyltransferase)